MARSLYLAQHVQKGAIDITYCPVAMHLLKVRGRRGLHPSLPASALSFFLKVTSQEENRGVKNERMTSEVFIGVFSWQLI